MNTSALDLTFAHMRELLGTASLGSRVPDVFRTDAELKENQLWRVAEHFGAAAVQNTISDLGKRLAVTEPRVAASMAVTAVLRVAIWQSVATHLLFDRVVDPSFDELQVGFDDGGGVVAGGLSIAHIYVGNGDKLAELYPDSVTVVPNAEQRWRIVNERLVALRQTLETQAHGCGRLPRRLIDGNVATIWLAVARHCAAFSESEEPVIDQMREQWAANPQLGAAIRRLTIRTPDGGTRVFAARRSCCLEYQKQGLEGLHFCGGCPLIKTEAIIRHREALDRGEHPAPLGLADRI